MLCDISFKSSLFAKVPIKGVLVFKGLINSIIHEHPYKILFCTFTRQVVVYWRILTTDQKSSVSWVTF